MKFAIRDDDTNYFTKPNELKAAYKSIWGRVPISLAVIPYISGISFAVRDNEDKLPSKEDKLHYMAEIEKKGVVPVRSLGRSFARDEIFPFGENKPLLNFLQEQIGRANVSLLLHGYNHCIYSEGYEFEVGENLYDKLKEGREYIAKLFGIEMKIFVPPNNTLSKEGLRAVSLNDMRVLTSGRVPLWSGVDCRITVSTLRKMAWWKFRYGKVGIGYPFVRDFSNFKLFYCQSLGYSTPFQKLKDSIDTAAKFNGSFCVATHYYALLRSNRMRKLLLKLIEYVENRYGNLVKFVSANELFEEKE